MKDERNKIHIKFNNIKSTSVKGSSLSLDHQTESKIASHFDKTTDFAGVGVIRATNSNNKKASQIVIT